MVSNKLCVVVFLQMFFGLLSLVLVGVKYKSDKRDMYLQHGACIQRLFLYVFLDSNLYAASLNGAATALRRYRL